MSEEVQVSDIMTARPVVGKVTDTVAKTCQRMKRHKVSSIPIMDGKEVKGIVTSDDIVYRIFDSNRDVQTTPITEIMTTELVSISPAAPVEDAVRMFTDNGIRQLPVIQERKLFGYLTLKDVLRIQPELINRFQDNLLKKEEQRQEWVSKYVNKEFLDEDLFD